MGKDRNYFISDIYLGFRNKPHFTIVVRQLIDAKSYVMRATLDPDKFYLFLRNIGRGKGVDSALVSKKGFYQVVDPDAGKLLRKNEQPPDPEGMRLIKDSVAQIDIQIERCKQITRGLLNFARKTEAAMKPVLMQEFLPEMVKMVEQRALVENVRIIQALDPDLPAIISDANQLQQVFLNLLNNSIHALKGKDTGEIRISLSLEDGYFIEEG